MPFVPPTQLRAGKTKKLAVRGNAHVEIKYHQPKIVLRDQFTRPVLTNQTSSSPTRLHIINTSRASTNLISLSRRLSMPTPATSKAMGLNNREVAAAATMDITDLLQDRLNSANFNTTHTRLIRIHRILRDNHTIRGHRVRALRTLEYPLLQARLNQTKVNINRMGLSRTSRILRGHHIIRELQVRTLAILYRPVEVHSLHLGTRRPHGPLLVEVISRHLRLLRVNYVRTTEHPCHVAIVKGITSDLHVISAPSRD